MFPEPEGLKRKFYLRLLHWRIVLRFIPIRQKLYPVFHWQKSNGVLLGLWGAAIAMAGLGYEVDGAAYFFKYAYVFAVAAWLWSLGSWFTSDTVLRMNRRTRRQRRGLDTYSPTLVFLKKYSVPVFVTVLLGYTWYGISDISLRKELQSMQGLLEPASDPMPSWSCAANLHPDEYLVLIGKGNEQNAVVTNKSPHVILASNRFGPVLTIWRQGDGSILLFFEIRSSDGRIIVKFNGTFQINPNNIMEMKRDDRSSLRIVDQYGNEVINARYLNPHAFAISGRLNYGGAIVPIAMPHVSGICVNSSQGVVGADFGVP